ncbi:MAG: hypothetical protein HQL62_06775 [Magnetococcales bacterium]|nr:hypothetical protein [Magnetococcales bacterium]
MVAEGTVDTSEEEPKMVVERLRTLDAYRQEVCRELRVEADMTTLSDDVLERLEALLHEHRGPSCRVRLALRLAHANATLLSGEGCTVRPNTRLLNDMQTLFGVRSVSFTLGGERQDGE